MLLCTSSSVYTEVGQTVHHVTRLAREHSCLQSYVAVVSTLNHRDILFEYVGGGVCLTTMRVSEVSVTFHHLVGIQKWAKQCTMLQGLRENSTASKAMWQW